MVEENIMNKTIVKVLIESSINNLDCLFDYSVPDELQPLVAVGKRVIVPLQRRLVTAFIWELTDHSEFGKLRSIKEIVDVQPLLAPYHRELVEWIAKYYFCNRTEVLRLCLPPGSKLNQKPGLEFTVTLDKLFSEVQNSFPIEIVNKLREFTGLKEYTKELWKKQFQDYPELLEFLLRKSLIRQVSIYGKSRINHKKVTLCQWIGTGTEPETEAGKRVREILNISPEGLTRAQIGAATAVSSSVINRLIHQQKIKLLEQTVDRLPDGFSSQSAKQSIFFNPEQEQVCKEIKQSQTGKLFLLHGVTGSGKTEIYFDLAAQALSQGKQVLYLVPEISLTPQTLKRARDRFPNDVALLHSNMSDGERFDQWFKIKHGEASFVLGARSALFAPFSNLGLIIVDEEHETTYKQEESPRYHSRKVAQKLAELTGAKVIFGSATPAIESFYAAQTGHYHYMELAKRYNQHPLPQIVTVDMRNELKQGNRNVLSRALVEAIQETLALGEQIILLLNRRGHSTFVICRDCGQALQCPACEVSLTYHSQESILRCHYCDYRQRIPNICPNCHSTRIRYFGNGTQKLELELKELFDKARIVRMDLDSTAKKGAHQQIYQQLIGGEVDILLGTQMIAKGLDLPRVTLVGVISADSALNMPDFRSAERAFHLLTQVAGRAGRRDKLGRVIFQTYNPDHYSIQFAKNHDYKGFYETEIQNRRLLNYPPFSELIKFGFSGEDQAKVIEAADNYGKLIKTKIEQLNQMPDVDYFMEILGPAPALIEKIQNRHRRQILLKTNNPIWLEQVARETWSEFPFKKFSNVRIIRDRNPYSVL